MKLLLTSLGFFLLTNGATAAFAQNADPTTLAPTKAGTLQVSRGIYYWVNVYGTHGADKKPLNHCPLTCKAYDASGKLLDTSNSTMDMANGYGANSFYIGISSAVKSGYVVLSVPLDAPECTAARKCVATTVRIPFNVIK